MTRIGRRAISGLVIPALLGTAACGALVSSRSGPSTIAVAEAVAPTTLDPQASSLGADWSAWQLSYECLLEQDPSGVARPKLATGVVISADHRTYTFALRHGVKFHNGDDFGADDVVYTFDRLAKTGVPFVQSLFPTIKSVEALGADRVRFRLTTPDPSFLPNIASPNVAGCAILDRRVRGNLSQRMVGTGPYEQIGYTPNSQLDLTAFGDYWARPPRTKNLTIRYVPSPQTQQADLISGKADLIFPTPALVQELGRTRGIELASVLSGTVQRLCINSAEKPLDDVRVRQAIALAIDRDQMAEIPYLSTAVPSSYLPISLMSSAELRTMPNFHRDVREAKRLLREAGYPHGFHTSVMYIAGYSSQTDAEMALVQSQLADVGIRVELDPQEQAAWNTKLNQPDYDLSWNYYNYFPDPYQYLRPRDKRQGPTPASLQQLIDTLAATTERTYTSAIDKIAREEARIAFPDVPIVNQRAYVAYRSGLHGVRLQPSTTRAFLVDVAKS